MTHITREVEETLERIIHEFKTNYKLGGCMMRNSEKSKDYEEFIRLVYLQGRNDQLNECNLLDKV